MEAMSINTPTSRIEPAGQANDLAIEMKNIRKGKLNRQVFEHPEMAGKLVAMKASPVYNTRGDIIQALSSDLGTV